MRGSKLITTGLALCLTAGCAAPTMNDAGAADVQAATDSGGALSYTESSIAPMCEDLSVAGVRPTGFDVGAGHHAHQRLPFPFTLYSHRWPDYVAISPTGYVEFPDQDGSANLNQDLTVPTERTERIAIFWDALTGIPATSDILVATFGTAPSRRFVIEWRNSTFIEPAERAARMTFQLKMFENSAIEFHYCMLTPAATPDLVTGASATVGISTLEHGDQHSYNTPNAVSTMQAIRYTPH